MLPVLKEVFLPVLKEVFLPVLNEWTQRFLGGEAVALPPRVSLAFNNSVLSFSAFSTVCRVNGGVHCILLVQKPATGKLDPSSICEGWAELFSGGLFLLGRRVCR